MTRSSVVLTCRLVSLWFFFHRGLALLGALEGLYTYYGMAAAGVMRGYSHLDSLRIGLISSQLIQCVCELGFGFIFYGCGGGVVRFLFGSIDEPAKNA